MAARWVFLTKTAKSQFVSINSDLSPALRRPTVGCLREIDQFPEVDPIADIQEAVGPLDRVGPLVILPALGALEQFR